MDNVVVGWVLVAVGGAFDRASRHYVDNIVVFASQAPAEPAAAPARFE